MKTIFPRFAPLAFALLRIMAGVMFLMHGTQKLFGWPGGGTPVKLASMPGLAGVLELLAGSLIAIGLFTGIAAFIASGEMAAAFFIAHAPNGLNPLLNQGELAVLYCFLFLYVATHGAGAWSVDGAAGARGSRG
ncbi:MAG TPA: DoxX family protein [Thermoanaerobaculia bacterium]|nr:DoxX family protein [Thermoanaerobaculia bacterium]